MDMARILIIKTPQKYKKTTHSARISPLFCVYFYGYFDSWRDGGLGGMGVGGLGGMEENKKSGGGDVRAEALAWDNEWDKA